MGVVQYTKDKLTNLVANLGTSRDKAYHSTYAAPVVTDLDLVNAYRGAWLPRKIVDIPALDSCRKWREWQADKDQIAKIEALEKRLKVKKKTLEAMTKARLYGGAAIYIGTNDADPSKPVTDNTKIKHLTVLTRLRLTAGEMDINPDSPYYGLPAYYTLANTAVRVHPSRVVRFIGAPMPDDEDTPSIAANQWGWGDSVLTAIFDAIRQADGTTANIASLVFEAKVDVIKIPDFMAGLTDPAYERLVLERLTLAATAKGINGALLLDKEEEYEQKNASFSNLNDILMSFMQLVSGAADIPVTRLLGQSPGGLQASGDSDMRNYYDRVSAIQELEIQPALETLDNLIVRNALGNRPDDVWYRWASLWQSTDSERAEIGKTVADTIKTLADTKLIPDDALSEAAVNVLTERGVLPGLEQAMDDYSTEEDGEDGDDFVPVTPTDYKPPVTDNDIRAKVMDMLNDGDE
tara:strand:+ start:10781 stop:12172 length:1392 start_codon:yes stop_codon:yes gene_type:complete